MNSKFGKFQISWYQVVAHFFFHITTRVLDSAIEFLNQESKELKNCGLNFKFESHREVLG